MFAPSLLPRCRRVFRCRTPPFRPRIPVTCGAAHLFPLRSARPVARCGRALRLLIGLAPLLLLAACAQAPSIPEIIVVAASATMNEPAPVLAPSDSSLLYQAGATSTMAVAYVVDPEKN